MKIRQFRKDETELLKDFLYEAIFIPEGTETPDRTIIERPELSLYYEDFGNRKDDHCLIAEEDDKVIGAVWSRIMNDYGHVDDKTPSLAISLYKEYRNRGIGTKLLKEMLKELRKRGYSKVSLAVQKDNYALKMYKDLGFKIINENEQEYIMISDLDKNLTVKELDPSCISDIKPLFRSVFCDPPWSEDWSDDRQLDEYLKDLVEVRSPIVLGLYEDNELIGFSIGKIKHWCGGAEYFIEELCIDPDHQNKGYGRRFFSLIEDKLKEKDIHQIYLMTDRDKPAYGFYKKIGFRELPELTSFFKEF
ncbi:MAG: GNAT family N-acetyltransferase [Erysipelotrichaceae bacterium]|nr:GNAT family N-acetyltransferase [Erysipelotrichaceae bacterium]